MTGWERRCTRDRRQKGIDRTQGSRRRTLKRFSRSAPAPSMEASFPVPEPAGATGVQAYLNSIGIVDKMVINLPTCPVNPEWSWRSFCRVLAAWPRARDGTTHTLERDCSSTSRRQSTGRPYTTTVPDAATSRNGEFVSQFGSKEERGLLPLQRWAARVLRPHQLPDRSVDRRASWCVESGAPCIGCGSKDWVDNNAPFLKRMSDMQLEGALGLGNVQPGSVAAAVGGAAAPALVAHGLGMKAAGRVGDGPPMEETKAYDRKHGAKKGGDK